MWQSNLIRNESRSNRSLLRMAVAFVTVGLLMVSVAKASDEDEMARMQQMLNQQVMEKPFSVEDERKIDAYIADAMKKQLEPEVKKAPSYWRPGYTCADIYGYGWRAYRNCRYYHRYYGYYW